jgi:hypothetical protein
MAETDERQISFLRQPEKPRIFIKDNKPLADACNALLYIIDGREQELLQGNTTGDIDSRLCVEYWYTQGLKEFIPPDKKEAFITFFNKATQPEIITRARRYLSEHDYIRLPQKAIVNSEQHRSRISRSMR